MSLWDKIFVIILGTANNKVFNSSNLLSEILWFFRPIFNPKAAITVNCPKNALVEARTAYQYANNINDIKTLFKLDDKRSDFKFLKSTLSNIGVSVPTLYKQYTEICEEDGVKFLDFNIDHNFADCVDGFILVDIAKIKESTKQRYINQ